MRHLQRIAAITVAVTAVVVLMLAGCQNPENPKPDPKPDDLKPVDTLVTFTNLTADGSVTAATTKLILTFNKDITGLSAADITLSAGSTGAVKGTLTRTETGIYELAVSGITAGGSVSVSVTKSGYTISGTPKTVTVYYYSSSSTNIAVAFTNLAQNGSSTTTTTKLTLTFDKDIDELTAADITLSAGSTGAVKDTLIRTETGIYELAVAGISAEGIVTVSVTKSGYTITGGLKTVTVYRYIAPTDITAAFIYVTADGSNMATTTKLTLVFDKDIDGLSAEDIALDTESTGASKGSLTETGTGVYDLAINDISSSGSVIVAVSKPGYNITGGSKTVTVYYYVSPTDITVAFTSLTADGSPTATTTKLTLVFDKDITGLSTADITLDSGSTGASKGSLTETGTGVYDLAINDISSSGSVIVAVSKPGYNITGGSKTVTVYYRGITFTVDSIPAQTYTGNEIKPTVTVKDGSTILTLTTDYTVMYTDNTDVGTATVTINGVGNYTGSSGSRTFTINKAAGATVSAPTLNTKTHNSITIDAVTAPNTGQTIEYARNTENTAPSTGWQTDTTFTDLNAGTIYYIFARSVGNSSYETGAASGSLTVTILQTASSDRFEYYWVDEHGSLVTTSGGAVTVAAGETLTIIAQSTDYTVKQWHVDGANTGQNGNTYSFSSKVLGKYTVGLFVEKDGKPYNTNITITVAIPVTIAAIQGLTVPAVGETPVTSIIGNAQYSGTVTWFPAVSGTFSSGTQYTATVILTAKTGYTLQWITENFFTIAGAVSVSNSVTSGVVTVVFPSTVYVLGDTGPGGGKVFYYSARGFTMTDNSQVCHYLEAAPANMTTSLAWASSGYTSTNITGTGQSIGTGRKNTALILATDANAPAAKACNDYRGPNNLTDWFFPSIDELNQLYDNRAYVGGMGTSFYWSSSQYIPTDLSIVSALIWDFNDGKRYYLSNGKSRACSIRAIRAF